MSVRWDNTIVIRTPTVPTLMDHLTVLANMDIKEMVFIVKVCVFPFLSIYHLEFYFIHYIILPADIDECLSAQHNCHYSDANCINSKGSFNCTCQHGYQGNGSYCEGLYKYFPWE